MIHLLLPLILLILMSHLNQQKSIQLASTSSTVHSNKRSFIWNYCEDLRPHGWKCIVTKENGDICGQYFPSTTTKGSTTNTIYHLLSHHGIVNPKTADKVFMVKLIKLIM